jgi:hypothetical protein
MKQIPFFLLLIATGILLSLSVQSQGLKMLESNNGFKNYKLGSKYSSIYGIKNKDEDGADKVVISYTAEKIGEIPVQLIELFYLKDTLSKILVHVSPENHAKLLEGCKNSFGLPTTDVSDNEATRKAKNDNSNSGNSYRDQYLWKATKLSMEYIYIYPKVSGNAYTARELSLNYSLNNFNTRLQKAKKGTLSGKDF